MQRSGQRCACRIKCGRSSCNSAQTRDGGAVAPKMADLEKAMRVLERTKSTVDAWKALLGQNRASEALAQMNDEWRGVSRLFTALKAWHDAARPVQGRVQGDPGGRARPVRARAAGGRGGGAGGAGGRRARGGRTGRRAAG